MENKPSLSKRWQFSLLGILGYTTLCILPFAIGSWALRTGNWSFVLLGQPMAAGVIAATVVWLFYGTRKAFLVGYVAGLAVMVGLNALSMLMFGLMMFAR